MEIGNLNQRISFLEHHTVTDEIGNHFTQWEKVISCWAKVSVSNLQNAENSENGTTKEIRLISFTVRQTAYLMNINSTTHRISFRNQLFDIISAKPDYSSSSYMTFTCKIKEAGNDEH